VTVTPIFRSRRDPVGWLLALGYAAAVALHAAAAPRARLPAWLARLLPGYWLLHWAALLLALSDLVRDPTHWRKTEHGAAQRRNTLGTQPIWAQQVARTPAE